MYPCPNVQGKTTLNNVLQIDLKRLNTRLNYEVFPISIAGCRMGTWRCKLELPYPREVTIYGEGTNKKEAEKRCSAAACLKLLVSGGGSEGGREGGRERVSEGGREGGKRRRRRRREGGEKVGWREGGKEKGGRGREGEGRGGGGGGGGGRGGGESRMERGREGGRGEGRGGRGGGGGGRRGGRK